MFFACNLLAGEANLYNPYIHNRLPSQNLDQDISNMAKSLDGHNSNIQDEASHRKYWRQEVYPVVFGNAKSNHEVMVFIDYANPKSEAIWAQVLMASKSMNHQSSKIVVFAKSSEPYGTELMGGGIWITYARSAYALDYFRYTLARWNEVKRALQAKGIRKNFVYEYDATVTNKDYPILYSYLSAVRPAIPETDLPIIMQYAFDAGNVNMYQAVAAAKEYDVKSIPAVVVNGEILEEVSAQNIIAALK